jgi:hypothetical protein
MAPYIALAGGYLTDANATSECNFCAMSSTDTFLAAFNIYFSNRWRDFGLMWVYVIFNIFGAIFLYWLARVPKNNKKEEDEDGLQRSTTTQTNITRQLTGVERTRTNVSQKFPQPEPVFNSAEKERVDGSPLGSSAPLTHSDSTRVPSLESAK